MSSTFPETSSRKFPVIFMVVFRTDCERWTRKRPFYSRELPRKEYDNIQITHGSGRNNGCLDLQKTHRKQSASFPETGNNAFFLERSSK